MVKIITAAYRAKQPYACEDYVPVFDREGVTHRVLAQITDLVDGPSGNRPRNTITALAWGLIPDPCAPGIAGPTLEHGEAQVQTEVDKLINAGFVVERSDGTLEITDDGMVELCN